MPSHMRPLDRRPRNYSNQPPANPTNQQPTLADQSRRACSVEPAQRANNNVTIIVGPRHVNLIFLFNYKKIISESKFTL